MSGDIARRIEAGMDAAAAALLGAATALVLLRLDATDAYAATGFAVSFAGALYALRSIDSGKRFVLREFQPLPVGFDVPELVLTDADRISAGVDELILDDPLAKIGPDSRVTRLFDRSAMPQGRGPDQPDASEELYEAFAKLRRSLR